MHVKHKIAVMAAATALFAVPGVAVSQAAAGPGWHHVQDFPSSDEGGCHARGQWYLENGVHAYECRPAGVWELWVLTDS
ncbi:hypothetical protein [Embleya sp. NBC_00896]|uniref:hypothetical protein n=1 Tax=Embleya sp. NBC_00896 TaxID=2975961 RepID=UPI002F913CC4|nr:hypothetical protein OG928_38195 [Embleya sp. NBC_00896]